MADCHTSNQVMPVSSMTPLHVCTCLLNVSDWNIIQIYSYLHSRKLSEHRLNSRPKLKIIAMLMQNLLQKFPCLLSTQESSTYLNTGLNFWVLVHDGQNGLHAAVVHQIWFIPDKNQRHSAKCYITPHFYLQNSITDLLSREENLQKYSSQLSFSFSASILLKKGSPHFSKLNTV